MISRSRVECWLRGKTQSKCQQENERWKISYGGRTDKEVPDTMGRLVCAGKVGLWKKQI